jgi:hypothetical protein
MNSSILQRVRPVVRSFVVLSALVAAAPAASATAGQAGVNWQPNQATANLVDELGDWSKVYSHTDGGWSFDSSNPASFDNDTSRIKRTSTNTEDIRYYRAGGFTTGAIKVYYLGTDSYTFTLSRSSDNTNWLAVTTTNTTPIATPGGWFGTTFTPSTSLPIGTKYLKLELSGAPHNWAPQIAQVVLSYKSHVAGLTTNRIPGTPISPHFAGINAWMPHQIGAHVYNGKLEQKWSDVQESSVRIMRYGGNGVDHWANPAWVDPSDSANSTLNQYLTMVDSMRSKSIEPVLQVPVYGLMYSASQAADIVRYVNITNHRGVTYWIIGNEPDLDSGVYHYTTAAQVAAYIRPFATAMKAVDPNIKIIGPEITWYDPAFMNGLTNPGGADDITGADGNGNYYVDVISFHLYSGFDGSQSRSDVISKLMSPGAFNDDLSTLKLRLAACNSFHGRAGGNELGMAITEANVNHNNPPNDSLTGVGAKSFIGGQFWAELMGIAMHRGVDFVTFWSTIEGDELGYISHEVDSQGEEIRRPSYYHFQMMAQNFRGYSVLAKDNKPNVKTFGAQDNDQIAVMIMNQDQSSNFGYTVRLDYNTVSGADPLKINIDAGVAVEYSGIISTESSIVLVFDASGAIKKKIEYRLNDEASSHAAPTVTNY